MSMCPVCNGLTSIQDHCPKCSSLMNDSGKMSDFFAPYSPYREIDDVNMTNGFPDVKQHQCLHLAYCESCGYEQVLAFEEKEE
jgi:hypothetical protein